MISSLKNLFSLGRNTSPLDGATDMAEVDLEIDASLLGKTAKPTDLAALVVAEAVTPPETKAAPQVVTPKSTQLSNAGDKPQARKRQSKGLEAQKLSAKGPTNRVAPSKSGRRKGLGSLGFGPQTNDWVLPGSPGAPKIKMCSELDELWDPPVRQFPNPKTAAA